MSRKPDRQTRTVRHLRNQLREVRANAESLIKQIGQSVGAGDHQRWLMERAITLHRIGSREGNP